MTGVPITAYHQADDVLRLEKAARAMGIHPRQLVSLIVHRSLATQRERERQEKLAAAAAADTAQRSARQWLTDKQIQQLADMTAEGKTLEQIAAALGCHVNTVSNWKRKLAMTRAKVLT